MAICPIWGSSDALSRCSLSIVVCVDDWKGQLMTSVRRQCFYNVFLVQRECKILPKAKQHRTKGRRVRRHLKRKMQPLSHRLFQPALTHPGNFFDCTTNFVSKIGTNLFLCQPHRQRECQRCPGAPGPPVAPLGRLDHRTRLQSERRAPGPLPFISPERHDRRR
jgi:hypothetical protein